MVTTVPVTLSLSGTVDIPDPLPGPQGPVGLAGIPGPMGPSGPSGTISDIAFWGMTVFQPNVRLPPFPVSLVRSWNSFAGVGATLYWRDMETARGTYAWTAMDKWVTLFPGRDLLFTFGLTPGWANSSAGTDYPPTNMQDLFNFATAVATRYAGLIKYWEPINEASSTPWTPAQAVTATQGIAAAVKAVDGAALVLSPSTTWTNGPAYMDAMLAGGLGQHVDIMNYHAYPQVQSPTTPPEQVIDIVAQYKTIFANRGVTNKPIIVSEGSWLSNVLVTTADLRSAYACIYLLALYSGGIQRHIWFIYDGTDPVACGKLFNGTMGLLPEGIAYRETQKWLTGADRPPPPAIETGNTWATVLTRPCGYKGKIVWNSAGANTYTPTSEYIQYRDLSGRMTLIALPGSTSVQIAQKPILFETGNPV